VQSIYHGNNKRATINHEQDQKLGVTITNGCAKWTPDSIVDTLTNISLQVKPGKFCAVIGPVGSGKVSPRLEFFRLLDQSMIRRTRGHKTTEIMVGLQI
jgi:ABC-type dipeptide/oligopeptide/nickel transport system ATPase component